MTPPDPIHLFPSTPWSLVGRAGQSDTAVQRQALAELLQHYLSALHSYLTHVRRIPVDRAEDLLQEFLVSKILEEDLIRRVDQKRGRFRTFLLASLDRFLISVHRFETAQKRCAPMQAIESQPDTLACEMQPQDAFDLAWARQILQQTTALMEEECRRTNRLDVWGVFKHRILVAVTDPEQVMPYEELVEKYHLKSPAHAANILITAKRMYTRMLRIVIGEYELDNEGIDAEIADLRGILSRQRD